jgi:transcription antitermination factor NusG
MHNGIMQLDHPNSALTGAAAAAAPELEWFALSVNVRHEKVVAQILGNKGYETFLPLYTKRHEYERRTRDFELPLFPGYLFCRLDIRTRLPILTTPGVRKMVGAGNIPVPLEGSEIAAIHRAVEAGIPMHPHPYWRVGETGRIIAGPLAGVEGIVLKTKQETRLILSVSLLQRSVLLEVDSNSVVMA